MLHAELFFFARKVGLPGLNPGLFPFRPRAGFFQIFPGGTSPGRPLSQVCEGPLLTFSPCLFPQFCRESCCAMVCSSLFPGPSSSQMVMFFYKPGFRFLFFLSRMKFAPALALASRTVSIFQLSTPCGSPKILQPAPRTGSPIEVSPLPGR